MSVAMGSELSVGTRIRVKAGVTAPDLSEFGIEGWTGTIAELTGKKSNRKYIIQWDASTVEKMPPAYLEQCKQKQLYYPMVCLGGDDIEADDSQPDN